MVRLQPNEVQEIIKQRLHYNLYQASKSKNKRGKTYYANNDDFKVLNIVAKMRNKTVKQVLNDAKNY